jgi:L-alanine-DL-glutamate epimerase-like enolase superfamily enzyme
MKITRTKVRKINIPFRVSFKHALNASSEVFSVILEIHSEKDIGYGECVPRDYVTGETVDSVLAALHQHILPKLQEKVFHGFSEVESFLRNWDEFFPMLKKDLCARTVTELALLDLIGKTEDKNIVDLLGGAQTDKIIYSGVVSAENTEVVEQTLKKFNEFGLKQIKMKVGRDLQTDLDNIRLAHEIMGEKVQIRVDANAAWDLATAKKNLLLMADLGVFSCEQPMHASENYQALFFHLKDKIHISLDESLCSIEDGQKIIQHNEGDIFNLRVSKNGGLLNCLELHRMAKLSGLNCQLGAQVGETSLLSAAGRLLALLTGDLLFHEGSFGLLLLESDLTQDVMQFGAAGVGPLDFLKKPGLGVVIDATKLDAITENN